MDFTDFLLLIFIIFLIIISGFLSGSETAITAVSKPRIVSKIKQGNKRALYVKKIIDLYDSQIKEYVPWEIRSIDFPIPVFASSVLSKLQKWVEEYGCLWVIKTNLPPKGVIIKTYQSSLTPYPNIKTCHLNDERPELVINYSNKRLHFCGIQK